MQKSAFISACGLYRYRLSRIWEEDKPLIAFMMLNPSTADAELDDPTIRRCIGFAKEWGYGGLTVINLFALRATNPKELYSAADPIGPENDASIREVAGRVEEIVCAWGAHGIFKGRSYEVAAMLDDCNLSALRLTKAGQPSHPLYLPGDLLPKAYFGKERADV